jgi:hypothetical protein
MIALAKTSGQRGSVVTALTNEKYGDFYPLTIVRLTQT